MGHSNLIDYVGDFLLPAFLMAQLGKWNNGEAFERHWWVNRVGVNGIVNVVTSVKKKSARIKSHDFFMCGLETIYRVGFWCFEQMGLGNRNKFSVYFMCYWHIKFDSFDHHIFASLSLNVQWLKLNVVTCRFHVTLTSKLPSYLNLYKTQKPQYIPF